MSDEIKHAVSTTHASPVKINHAVFVGLDTTHRVLTNMQAEGELNVSTLNDAVNAVNEKRAALQKALEEAASPVLQAIADTGEVTAILVQGYTPGFNDGEACEHGVQIFVGVKEIMDEERHDSGVFAEHVEFGEEVDDAVQEHHDLPYVSRYNGATDEQIAESVRLHDEAKAKIAKAVAESGHIYEAPETRDIHNAMEAVIEPMLDSEFGTNYEVLYLFADGAFERHHSDYDCGY